MSRHAAPKAKSLYRSDSAQQAHKAGAVTHTIDIARSPAFEGRQRAGAALNRHALALGVVAAAFLIYDVGLLVTH